MTRKIFIYQVIPRLLGNSCSVNKYNGTIEENGCGKLEDVSSVFLDSLVEVGYTHIWLIGVLAHASTTDYTCFGIPTQFPEIIKGKAGSPYAVRDYYDVDPDLAIDVNNRMDEYERLIDRVHKSGLKVIMDFIPNHLARSYKSIKKPDGVIDFGSTDNYDLAFAPDNNFYYLPGEELVLDFVDRSKYNNIYREYPAKVTGNNSFTSKPSLYDWYETVKLNYGVDYIGGGTNYFIPIPNTWVKMRDILLFWAAKNIDGFRCDMAEMVPIEFWKWVIPQIKNKYSEVIFIAEIYQPSLYRDFLEDYTFDYLYDKVGLYDVLRDVSFGIRPSSDISFALNDVGDIQSRMLNFIENHDEQRVASDFFLGNGLSAKAIMIVTACVNVNPVMIYFGQELGERGMDEEGFSGKDGKTSIFDYWGIDTITRWNNNGRWNNDLLNDEEKELKDFYSKLIITCNKEKALSEDKFYDLMPANYNNVEFDSTKQFVFLRGCNDEVVLVVVSFDNKPVDVMIEIPDHAFEYFNLPKQLMYRAEPLLKNTSDTIVFSKENPVRLRINQNSGDIYKVLSL